MLYSDLDPFEYIAKSGIVRSYSSSFRSWRSFIKVSISWTTVQGKWLLCFPPLPVMSFCIQPRILSQFHQVWHSSSYGNLLTSSHIKIKTLKMIFLTYKTSFDLEPIFGSTPSKWGSILFLKHTLSVPTLGFRSWLCLCSFPHFLWLTQTTSDSPVHSSHLNGTKLTPM